MGSRRGVEAYVHDFATIAYDPEPVNEREISSLTVDTAKS